MNSRHAWVRSGIAALVGLGAIALRAEPGLAAHQRLFVGLGGHDDACNKDADGNMVLATAAGLDAANNQICNAGSQGATADSETYCSNGNATRLYVRVSSIKPDGTSITRAQSTTESWNTTPTPETRSAPPTALTYFSFTTASGTSCVLEAAAEGQTY